MDYAQQTIQEHFGDYLVEQHDLTEEQRYDVLMYQADHPDMTFGECCVALGYMDDGLVEAEFLDYAH